MIPDETSASLGGRDRPRAVFVTDFVHLGIPFEDLAGVLLDPGFAWINRLQDRELEGEAADEVATEHGGDDSLGGEEADGPPAVSEVSEVSDGSDAGADDAASDGADPEPRAPASAILRVGVGPRASQPVALYVGTPRRHGDSVIVPISWEPAKFERLLPKLEADLELSDLDEGFSRLSISGRYRAPFEAFGYNLDRLAFHRVAEASLRRFLRQVEEALVSDISSN